MINSINLRVDLSLAFVNKKIHLHEGDVNGTELVLSVYDNNSAFDLSGCTAEYDATIDGCLAEEAAAATITPDTNTIKVPVTANMTALSGLLLIDVKIKKNNDILTVYTVSADVKRAVINGATIIDISGTSLMQKINNIESIYTTLNDYYVPITVSNQNPTDDITDTEKYRFWYNQVNRTMYVLRNTNQGGPIYWQRCNIKTTISSALAPARSPNNVDCQYGYGDIWVGHDNYFLELYVCTHAIKRTEGDVWWYEYTWLRVNEHYYTKDEIDSKIGDIGSAIDTLNDNIDTLNTNLSEV